MCPQQAHNADTGHTRTARHSIKIAAHGTATARTTYCKTNHVVAADVGSVQRDTTHSFLGHNFLHQDAIFHRNISLQFLDLVDPISSACREALHLVTCLFPLLFRILQRLRHLPAEVLRFERLNLAVSAAHIASTAWYTRKLDTDIHSHTHTRVDAQHPGTRNLCRHDEFTPDQHACQPKAPLSNPSSAFSGP